MRIHLSSTRGRRVCRFTRQRLLGAGVAVLCLWPGAAVTVAQTADPATNPATGPAADQTTTARPEATPVPTAPVGERYQPERTREDYAPPSGGEGGFDYAAQTLRVSLWLDRDEDEIYNRGDEQRVTFQTNEDAYAVVYRIDTEGLVTVLWPRDRIDDGFVFGGHEYRLPGREASALRIDEAEGEGYVQAIVSRYPFDLRALELDFLQGDTDTAYDFHVAGDPFLAMNEVNYAVTGLKDSADQVITNNVRYYVHRQVDHPRYLCSQCHTGDSARYDPYESQCTLNIDSDYGWANNWYETYGYYPVYWNPVYVYVDPWTWYPWVNFWYDPWYSCAPYNGWYGSYWGCYPWYDSPYYGGGCGSYAGEGGRRYQPLNRSGDATGVQKGHEYATVSRQVTRSRLEPAEREAMAARRTMTGRTGVQRGDRATTGASPVTVARGEKPAARAVERFPASASLRQGGNLRIRPGGRGGTTATEAGTTRETTRRHTAAGVNRAAKLAPVTPRESGGATGQRRSGDTGSIRGSDGGQRREGERDGVRALNPRQRGQRVWNSTTGRSDRPAERGERQDRPTRVRSERSGDAAAPAVQPRADSGRRGGTVPRGDGTPSRSGRETSPRAGQSTPRTGRESTPAPSQSPAPRQSGSSRSGGGAARRAPFEATK